MTPRTTGRRHAATPTASALAVVALSALVVACGGRRERLDVPRIALDVADQAPPPGGRITGHVEATDQSGLTLLTVYACTADSLFRQGLDLDRVHSAGFDFSLHVASTATPGAEVEVYAVAGDDQGFYADTARALAVGGVAAPATADVAMQTAEAICPRVIHVRRAPLRESDAPTAPRP
ncbi:MAG TPA: hypothetical protein VNS52_07855 [Gemmatimonadaceae bacterium]|nr:hypothetical protein [Gemmatimonadaceae bacterium]